MQKHHTTEPSTKLELILEALKQTKGKEIVTINLEKVENAISSHFVICHGTSTTQVNGLSDSVQEKIKSELNENAYHIEGRANSFWILMDYGDIIVHIFLEETRSFYKLEDLWADGQIDRIEEE